jgi:hypothetical protein
MRLTRSVVHKKQHEINTAKDAASQIEKQHHIRIASMKKETQEASERAARAATKSALKLAAAERRHTRILLRSELKLSAAETTAETTAERCRTIVNMTRNEVTAKDDCHALELEEKDNKIRVSPSFDIIIAFLVFMTHNLFARA